MTLDDKHNSNDVYGDQERVPTPDEVWKILKRVAQHQEDMVKHQARYEQEVRKLREANAKQINKMRGIWSNAWGDFVESLLNGCLVEMIQEWIPSINQIMKNIECELNGRHCEIDIIAANNDSLVATEVKSNLSVTDVKDFLERLKSFTMFFPQFKDYKIYGAIAYLKTSQNAEKFAMRRGLFVIKVTGDHREILNKKGVFKPEVIKQIYDNI